jgi:hypothetical protein
MRRLVCALAGIAALLAAVIGAVVVSAPAYADGNPLVQGTAIVNPPPQPGLLSLCVTSRSLLPNGTCIHIPPSAGTVSAGGTFGTATAVTFNGSFGSGVSFRFQGQITIGGRTFAGVASGGSGGLGPAVSPFTLSGTSATGSLTARCSGYFEGYGENPVGYGSGIVVGGAASVLSCDGSVNGGPVGHVTLVSAYRATDWTVGGPDGSVSTYEGEFAGA